MLAALQQGNHARRIYFLERRAERLWDSHFCSQSQKYDPAARAYRNQSSPQSRAVRRVASGSPGSSPASRPSAPAGPTTIHRRIKTSHPVPAVKTENLAGQLGKLCAYSNTIPVQQGKERRQRKHFTMIRRFHVYSIARTGLALSGLVSGGLVLDNLAQTHSLAQIQPPNARHHTSRIDFAEADSVMHNAAQNCKVAEHSANVSHLTVVDTNSHSVIWTSAIVSSSMRKATSPTSPSSVTASSIPVIEIKEGTGDHPNSSPPAVGMPIVHTAGSIPFQDSSVATRPALCTTGLKGSEPVPLIVCGDSYKNNNTPNNAAPSAAPEPSSAVTLAGLILLTGLVLRHVSRRIQIAGA